MRWDVMAICFVLIASACGEGSGPAGAGGGAVESEDPTEGPESPGQGSPSAGEEPPGDEEPPGEGEPPGGGELPGDAPPGEEPPHDEESPGEEPPGDEEPPCEPVCGERQCGLDPVCGTESCGECEEGEVCDDGACLCAGEACAEGCCGEGEVCLWDGACCAPDCGGRECGDDGCGGSCGPGCSAGELCAWESGSCVTSCACDFDVGFCEPDAPDSFTACGCDPDCAPSPGGGWPCTGDGYCDVWCPIDSDPDCYCSCDYNGYCEAAEYGSTATCMCDEACEPHESACSDDGHCDSWCPAGADPDCGLDPCRARAVRIGRRYGEELLLEGSFAAPDPAEGALWALLSRGAAEGTGQLVVGIGAEHVECIDRLEVRFFGYDDSGSGEAAAVTLFNWETYGSDPLPGAVAGAASGEYSGETSDPGPYLLCGTGLRPRCFVHAELTAPAAARTHIGWVEAWAHVSPR